MGPVDDGASSAPIDRSVLEQMQSRFVGNRLIESAKVVEEGSLHLRVELSSAYYPGGASARFEIRWYRNDDFSVHYQEERRNSAWQCRWDRHPNTHNSRDHFHPPPAANHTEAEDAQWPADHRNVCRIVFEYVEKRVETLWERQQMKASPVTTTQAWIDRRRDCWYPLVKHCPDVVCLCRTCGPIASIRTALCLCVCV